MKARPTRKVVQELTLLCKELQIDLTVEPARGKGSHQGLVFTDPTTGNSVTITIPGTKDVSPGVQREILKYLAGLATHVVLAEIIRELLERILRG
jgi:predicted RNA binding protein YcfA (HicA-like mRNA interferase family)